jgi:hypothetical protein
MHGPDRAKAEGPPHTLEEGQPAIAFGSTRRPSVVSPERR